MSLNWAQTRSQRPKMANQLKSNLTFHAWRTLGYLYGPSDCFPPLQSLFLLTISTFLPFSALHSSPPSLSMGGCFFPFSLLPTPPGLPLLWQPPPFTPLPDHSSVSPACVCLSPNFIQRNQAGQINRTQKGKRAKQATKVHKLTT